MDIVRNDFKGFALIALAICIGAGLNRTLHSHQLPFAEVFAYKIRSASPSDNVNEISLPVRTGFNIRTIHSECETCHRNIVGRMAQLWVSHKAAH